MNPYNLDITKIVKYVCLTAIAIVGIVFASITTISVYGIKVAADEEWED